MHSIRCRRCMYVCCTIVATSLSLPVSADAVNDTTATHRSKPKHSATAATDDASADTQHGNASFYSRHLSGRRTASGQTYDPNALTAAHRTLPLGTQVRVVNPKNDRSVVVTVNDRGPVPKNRMIDVSSAAADELGMKKAGVTKVETQVLGKAPAGGGN